MPDIHGGEALVNSMNGITGMPDVGFRLVDGRSRAGKTRHDRYAGAVEAEMAHAEFLEESVPELGRVFRKLHQRRPLLSDRLRH